MGTYSWRVRALDEHGLYSAWTAADEFTVTLAGTAPVCTLFAWGPAAAPLVSYWTYTDADGDFQTHYQVQLDDTSDSFLNVIEDSGEVESTNLYHTHSTTTPGTYYRRARVKTASTDWSAYVDDTITIVADTAQSSDMQLYRRYADGTVCELHVPISNLVVQRQFDAPTQVSFSINNFYPAPEHNLKAVWLFDEDSGTTAHDLLTAYDLTLVNTPTWGSEVLTCATNEYGYSGAITGMTSAGDWTVVMVVKPSGSSGTVMSLATSANDTHYQLVKYSASTALKIGGAAGGAETLSDALTVSATSYQCLIAESASGTLTLYRMDTATSKTAADTDPTGTPRVGLGVRAGTSKDQIADALVLSMVLVYSDALSSAERTQAYRAVKEYLKYRSVIVS